jgi:hypothetical protein
MVFDTEQELPQLPHKLSADRRLYYIRIQNPPTTVLVPSDSAANRRHGLGGFPGRTRIPVGDEFPLSAQADQLEPFLKPLDPHLFDVMSDEQFRKALAQIMSELSGQ